MSESIKQKINEYIKTEILFGDDGNPLTNDKPLLGDVIDSMGIQMLVPFLESEYNISIPDLELIPENFDNINVIAAMVSRLSEKNR